MLGRRAGLPHRQPVLEGRLAPESGDPDIEATTRGRHRRID